MKAYSKKTYDLTGNENDENGENENESSSSSSEDEEKDEPETSSESDKVETFKKIIPILKPNESILKAIKRLGKSSSAGSGSATGSMSASQRWLKKKNQQEAKGSSSESANASADKELVEKLTGYANFFIDQGFYDIYEETAESLQRKVDNYEKRASKMESSSDPFDIFAEEVDEKELKSSTNVEEEALKGNSFY